MDPMTIMAMIQALPTVASAAKGGYHDLSRLFGGKSTQPGFFDMLLGRSAEIQDPFYGPSGDAYTALAQQLQGGMGGLDIAGSQPYQSAMGGLQSLLSGDTLSTLMAPALRMFQEQIMPQTASAAMGQGMSRGRSAMPAYLAQAAERMGQSALSQQAGMVPQALQDLLRGAGMPGEMQIRGLGALGQARGTTVQRPAMEGFLPALGSHPMANQSAMHGLQQMLQPQQRAPTTPMSPAYRPPQPFSLAGMGGPGTGVGF